MMRLPLSLLALGLTLSLVGPLVVRGQEAEPEDPQESAFDRLNRRLDERFNRLDAALEAEFEALNAFLEDSYQAARAKVEGRWGEDSVMPERTRWAGYDAEFSSRILIDYEAGEAVFQSLTEDDPAALQARFNAIVTQSGAELDQLDPVIREVRQRVADRPGAFGPAPPRRQDGSLSGLVDRTQASVRPGRGRIRGEVRAPLTGDWHVRMASEYYSDVARHADRYALPRRLVFAVMHTESSFNPRARSHIPAYGLMQLVPSSGGADAWQFLGREGRQPHPEILYRPAANVELGTTYLHILNSRYLAKVRDPVSRTYVVIAAYNTGSGNVARAFGYSKTQVAEAVARINTMTPDAVYRQLRDALPYDETKNYLRKVRERMALYEQFEAGR